MLDYKNFKDVGSEYRSAPFWSLNDKLEKEHLVKQIREMHSQGIGGFFMHPRSGLKDAYLKEDFIAAIRACIEEAHRLDMKAYLYDEDGFPSGSAGGYVTANRPDFVRSALVLVEMPCGVVKEDKDLLAVFRMKDGTRGSAFENISSMKAEEINRLDGTAVVFLSRKMRGPDLCNREAVKEFIRITHEKYKEEFGKYFGKTVPGIFSDEPSFTARSQEGRALPWTPGLPELFKEAKGYDLLEHLPALFYDAEGYRKVRFDYWDTMTRLFAESFSRTIYDWCEENGISFTGHYWEHEFPSPLYTGSTMPNYEYMQFPGIDMLFNTEEEDTQVGNVLIVKEVSSVGNQMGKKRVLSETYGASGWDLNFRDQKRIADWQFALGINFVCQHLVHYSLKGARKRDFPLSFMDHQPWWNNYRILGDYLGRLSYAMSQGKYPADILVLHPYSSIWAEYRVTSGGGRYGQPAANPEAINIENSVKWLTKALCQLRYQYDLGDDILMEKYGRVEGGRLVIGQMSYKTVILPEMQLLRSSSFRLLKELVESGGTVIATAGTPVLLDGVESEELKDFFASDRVIRVDCRGRDRYNSGKRDLDRILTRKGNLGAKIVDLNGKDISHIYCHIREAGDRLVYFLCSIDKRRENRVRLYIGEPWHTEEWDAVTGEKREISVCHDEEGAFVELDFYPSASHLLVVNTGVRTEAGKAEPERSYRDALCKVLGGWKVERVNYNALPIKQCRYRVSGGDWSELTDSIATASKIKEVLVPRVREGRRQPWAYSEEEKAVKIPVEIKYTFTVDRVPGGKLFVAVESPEENQVFVNGRKASCTGEYFHDRAFVMHDIKDLVKAGENEMVLVNDGFNILSEVEWVYIAGDFRLKGKPGSFVLDEEEGPMVPGDWTLQGYPYYSGTVKYTSEFNLDSANYGKVELVLGKAHMVAARAKVNGKDAGVFAWEPYSLDITALVKEGRNEVTIEVANSLRNLLGPHSTSQVDGFCHPGSFYIYDGDARFVESGFYGDAFIRIYP